MPVLYGTKGATLPTAAARFPAGSQSSPSRRASWRPMATDDDSAAALLQDPGPTPGFVGFLEPTPGELRRGAIQNNVSSRGADRARPRLRSSSQSAPVEITSPVVAVTTN